jgi:hypothetical protein
MSLSGLFHCLAVYQSDDLLEWSRILVPGRRQVPVEGDLVYGRKEATCVVSGSEERRDGGEVQDPVQR